MTTTLCNPTTLCTLAVERGELTRGRSVANLTERGAE